MTRNIFVMVALIALVIGCADRAEAAQRAAKGTRAIALDAATLVDINAAYDANTLSAEKLVRMYLKRIDAYDKQGPSLNSVIVLNPKALATARALDAERRKQGPRSALHGIPVLLKDNFDTVDLPTTGGSILLQGSIPPDDAYTVRRLREAGAIILGKVNMAEFAYGDTHGSLIGQTLNPHDPARSASGSSGGTAAAVAATFAAFGMGTDTSGSIREPAAFTGIVGLRPTMGLLSRDGIIPLALSFDTAGPMARHVYDVAAALSTMTGVDPADDATQASAGLFRTDYAQQLNGAALNGARIGVARDFKSGDGDVDWVMEASLQTLRDAGATLVDVSLPPWLLTIGSGFDRAIHYPEFRVQIAQYLATTGPGYPKNIDDLIARSNKLVSLGVDGVGPSPWRWGAFKREAAAPGLDDSSYTAVRDHGMPLVRAVLEGVLSTNKLDAIVFPAQRRRPWLIDSPASGSVEGPSAVYLSILSGFPELVVPAGFTDNKLPVGISLLGRPFSEAKLLALGYSFEQASHARRLPRHTPLLPEQFIRVPCNQEC
ncbi:MAG TPA: amidase family protein [Steroidobacter sp.]